MRPSPLALLAAAAVLPATLAACGGGGGTADGSRPTVAATAPQVEVIADALAGDGIDVETVVPVTADVHELELRPSQVTAITDADLLLRPGRENDAWATEAIDRSSAKQVNVAAKIPGDDRHWWMDPAAVMQAADVIAVQFDTLDPGGATQRAAALAALRKGFNAIDQQTRTCLASVPAADRKIVTDHDAAGAYAKRYGLDVVGTISPGSEPEAAPSAKHLVELEQLMRREGVTAVFPIAPHGSQLVGQVAQRGGAKAGDALWADALPGATHDHEGDDHADHEAEGDHAGEASATPAASPSGSSSASADADHNLLLEAAELNGASVAAALGASSPACATQ